MIFPAEGQYRSDSAASIGWTVTAIIAFTLCLVQLGTMASLMVHQLAFALVAPSSFLLAIGAAGLLLRRTGQSTFVLACAAGTAILLVVIAAVLSAFFFDLSWDGQWYHQSAIINMARGWSPVTDPMHTFIEHNQLWVRHYAKGPWYFAAAVYRTTGHIELGKAITWLSAAALFSAVWAACLEARMHRWAAFGLALVITLNPVVTSELTTFLVDGIMICFLVISAVSLVTLLYRPNALVLATCAASSIVCINTKFTGLIYLCFVFAGAGAWCLLKSRQQLRGLVLLAGVVLLLGTCVWGYNPYATNTLYRHQPFYPLLGSAKFPSLAQQGDDGNEKYETPRNMAGRNELVRFVYATFGRPGNQPYFKGKNASLMWPFTANRADLYAYTYHETRVAGFGPLFSGCLLLSLLLGVSLLIGSLSSHGSPGPFLLVLTSTTLLASLLISHHLWWPRYGPQFWLLPILPILFALRDPTSRLRVNSATVLLTLLVINALTVAFVRLQWETKASHTLHQQLRSLSSSGSLYDVSTYYFEESWHVRLTEAGVRYRDTGMDHLPKGSDLMSVVEHYPASIRYQPSQAR